MPAPEPLPASSHHAVPAAAFHSIPGVPGLRLAHLGHQQDGRTLEVVEGMAGVILPAMTQPSAEHGRVLRGSVRFMQDGVVRDLVAGDAWDLPAETAQGPHVFLEDGTQVAILRDGRSSFDLT